MLPSAAIKSLLKEVPHTELRKIV